MGTQISVVKNSFMMNVLTNTAENMKIFEDTWEMLKTNKWKLTWAIFLDISLSVTLFIIIMAFPICQVYFVENIIVCVIFILFSSFLSFWLILFWHLIASISTTFIHRWYEDVFGFILMIWDVHAICLIVFLPCTFGLSYSVSKLIYLLMILGCCFIVFCIHRVIALGGSDAVIQIPVESELEKVTELFKFNEEEEIISEKDPMCPMCQDNYMNGDIVCMPSCRHHTHKRCILPWFIIKESMNCIMCFQDYRTAKNLHVPEIAQN